MNDRMQQSRFELKYLVREETAGRISDFVQNHMDLDPYGAGRPDRSYEVHSLYLDSDDLKTYWWTINGDRNRFKLRLRFYETRPDAPVYCEIKRRHNNCVLKQRGGIAQELVPQVLAGQLPAPAALHHAGAVPWVALQNFTYLAARLQARPRVHIAYLREAYLHKDDHLRVTLDRRVLANEHLQDLVPRTLVAPVINFPDWVILELKFTDRFPKWFQELVEAFEVVQCGVPKYVESVQNLGERRLHALDQVLAPTFTPGHVARERPEEPPSPAEVGEVVDWNSLPTPMWLPPAAWRETFVAAKRGRTTGAPGQMTEGRSDDHATPVKRLS